MRLTAASTAGNSTTARTASTLMGFDYGERRIGVAVGQTLTTSATPVTAVANRNGQVDWQGIEKLINEWSPTALVVGIPESVDHESKLTPLINSFCRKLEGRFNLPVHTIDESLSSVQAYETLRTQRQQGTRRKKIDKSDIDALAAAIILESWMQQLSSNGDAR